MSLSISYDAGPPGRMVTALVHDRAVQGGDGRPVPWWSFTKTVLAAAALVLVSQLRLDLDGALPGEAFTLRQLLQHRSGLPDYGSLAAYHAAVARGEAPWPDSEMLRLAGAEKLLFLPGSRFAYSNIGYLLVRRLIETAFDGPSSAALDALVLRPLGIRNVVLAAEPADLDGTEWGNAARYHPGWVYHGLLAGTPAQAALLLHRLLGGELLPPVLLQEMCAGQAVFEAVPGRPWEAVAYGLGLGVCDAAGGRFVGHTGAGPGSVAAVYRGPGGVTAAAFAAGDGAACVEDCVIGLAGGG